MRFKTTFKVLVLGSAMVFIPFSKAGVLDSVSGFFKDKKQTTSVSKNQPAPITAASTQPISLNTTETATGMNQTDSQTSMDINAQAIKLASKAVTLDPTVIKLGLQAYEKARSQGLDSSQILTIVNYQQPSTEPRMYVFDLKTNNLLFKELVAHGKNSGDNVPHSFSNAPSSLKSSIGLFLTTSPYIGEHGYSLRVDGLEKGFNDMAASRDIVVHAANYVSQAFARAHGRLGKSWGCFAVDPTVASSLISTIKGGTLIFAYYPDQNYLAHSNYLI